MRYGSVCSGIEAATVAWHPLGWEPAFFSEIEAAPRAVLAHHYPDVPCHGDFTTIGAEEYGSIDLLVGGTPCQSFSIAGLRGGLDDDRGNLALEFIKLAQRTRPRWVVWENVPGVLSSNRGRDFGTFLAALGEIGYGFAYRVLDAQYFGVAQRRRRVFVVGCLGNWRSAAAVLFERHSLQGHSAPSREKGKEVAGTITRSSFAGGSGGKPDGAAGNHFIPEIAGTMISRAQSGGFSNSADHAAASYIIPWPAEIASTLNAAFGSKLGLEDQHIRSGAPLFVPGTVGFDAYNNEITGDVSKTIDTGQDYHHVPIAFAHQQGGSIDMHTSKDCGLTIQKSQIQAIEMKLSVRRITPRECERLQGFPDDYTLVPHRNKPMADGPRYKALGNSMAVPVMRWIGERIQMVEDIMS